MSHSSGASDGAARRIRVGPYGADVWSGTVIRDSPPPLNKCWSAHPGKQDARVESGYTHYMVLKKGMLLPSHGAFVISLDFELRWGVHDSKPSGGAYDRWLYGAREVIPRLLELFSEYDIAATWATVGFLFTKTREELMNFSPADRERPTYTRQELNPYSEAIGDNETSDPLHFAESLIRLIAAYPRQEIATHTFSHFYCLEPGQSDRHFRADLRSAVTAARARGLELQSIVFPRNQDNAKYHDILSELGILCYRGNQSGAIYKPSRRSGRSLRDIARFADSYVAVCNSTLTDWAEVAQPDGLFNVPASRFLRPFNTRGRFLEPWKERRVIDEMRRAAASHSIYHLWWHPHNFGGNCNASLALLRRLLTEYRKLQDKHGLVSMSMVEVATRAPARMHRAQCQR